MTTRLHARAARLGSRAAIGALALAALLFTAACASTAKSQPTAAQPLHTPVPPAALATLPPPTPRPGETPIPANETAITIANFNFTPATITVAPGTTITWSNHDDVQHTVTASDKSFGSDPIDTDKSFSFTFKNAGTFSYFCAIHPFMSAKVIVQ